MWTFHDRRLWLYTFHGNTQTFRISHWREQMLQILCRPVGQRHLCSCLFDFCLKVTVLPDNIHLSWSFFLVLGKAALKSFLLLRQRFPFICYLIPTCVFKPFLIDWDLTCDVEALLFQVLLKGSLFTRGVLLSTTFVVHSKTCLWQLPFVGRSVAAEKGSCAPLKRKPGFLVFDFPRFRCSLPSFPTLLPKNEYSVGVSVWLLKWTMATGLPFLNNTT